jgi:hypothetical protein
MYNSPFGDPPVHLPRPKNSPRGCFCPAGRGRGVATCGYRIRLRPLGGACLLRPLRLLRLPVSAAGGGRLRSRLFDSRTPLLLTMYNKKKKAQPLAKLSFLVTRTGIELLSFYKYPLMQYVLTIILSLVWISLKGIFISVWYKVWYSSYKKCGTAPACKNK